jgi:hypothetical protein
MKYQVLWLPKDGNSNEEYEDAFAPTPEQYSLRAVQHDDPSQEIPRFAVADGATESSFAQQWAHVLVNAFVNLPTAAMPAWSDWLSAAQQEWKQTVGEKKLPWYAEPKFKAGAFATLLGLQFSSVHEAAGEWRAVAIGDSCLFQVREGFGFIDTFPIADSETFGSTPFLIGSRSPVSQLDNAVWRSGEWQRGDRFWLMTDALAKWCFERREEGGRPWELIETILNEPDRFAIWIASLWQSGQLRNDDITLAAIHLNF